MRSLGTFRAWFALSFGLAFVILPHAAAQVADRQDLPAQPVSTVSTPSAGMPGESACEQPTIRFRGAVDLSGLMPGAAASRSGVWTPPGGFFARGKVQTTTTPGSGPKPGRTIRKLPLALGIVGAVVAVSGIVMAADSCGHSCFGPSFRTAGIVTAGVGGAVAVTGFYFAFKR
jgi:hypothetical protein